MAKSKGKKPDVKDDKDVVGGDKANNISSFVSDLSDILYNKSSGDDGSGVKKVSSAIIGAVGSPAVHAMRLGSKTLDYSREVLAERVNPDAPPTYGTLIQKGREFSGARKSDGDADEYSKDLWKNYLGVKNNLEVVDGYVKLPKNLKSDFAKFYKNGVSKKRLSDLESEIKELRSADANLSKSTSLSSDDINTLKSIRDDIRYNEELLSDLKKVNGKLEKAKRGDHQVFSEFDVYGLMGGKTPAAGLGSFTMYTGDDGHVYVKDKWDLYSPNQDIGVQAVTKIIDTVVGKPFEIKDRLYADGGKKKSSSKKVMSFDDFLNHYDKKSGNEDYRIERAYEIYANDPESFDRDFVSVEDDGYHFPTVDPETGVFLKSKFHPDVNKEYEWFKSDDPEAVKHRERYALDTIPRYPRYIDKYEDGGGSEGSGDGFDSTVNNADLKALYVMNRLIDSGIGKPQAVAVAANIYGESAFDSKAVNKSNGTTFDFGLMQWVGPRKKMLKSVYGENPTFDDQINFLIDEMKGKYPGLGWNFQEKGVLYNKDERYDYYMPSKKEFEENDSYLAATLDYNAGYGRTYKKNMRNDTRMKKAHEYASMIGLKPEDSFVYRDRYGNMTDNVEEINRNVPVLNFPIKGANNSVAEESNREADSGSGMEIVSVESAPRVYVSSEAPTVVIDNSDILSLLEAQEARYAEESKRRAESEKAQSESNAESNKRAMVMELLKGMQLPT